MAAAGGPDQRTLTEHRTLVAEAAAEVGLSPDAVLGPDRDISAVHARYMIMQILHERGLGPTAIGAVVRRPMASVISGLARGADLERSDPDYQWMITMVRRRCR